MKIKYSMNMYNRAKFVSLSKGGLFILFCDKDKPADSVFMKIDETCDKFGDYLNAVDLTDGEYMFFDNNVDCIPIEAELQIYKIG